MVALLRSILQRNLPVEPWRREVWAHVVISQPANIVATACDRTGNIWCLLGVLRHSSQDSGDD